MPTQNRHKTPQITQIFNLNFSEKMIRRDNSIPKMRRIPSTASSQSGMSIESPYLMAMTSKNTDKSQILYYRIVETCLGQMLSKTSELFLDIFQYFGNVSDNDLNEYFYAEKLTFEEYLKNSRTRLKILSKQFDGSKEAGSDDKDRLKQRFLGGEDFRKNLTSVTDLVIQYLKGAPIALAELDKQTDKVSESSVAAMSQKKVKLEEKYEISETVIPEVEENFERESVSPKKTAERQMPAKKPPKPAKNPKTPILANTTVNNQTVKKEFLECLDELNELEDIEDDRLTVASGASERRFFYNPDDSFEADEGENDSQRTILRSNQQDIQSFIVEKGSLRLNSTQSRNSDHSENTALEEGYIHISLTNDPNEPLNELEEAAVSKSDRFRLKKKIEISEIKFLENNLSSATDRHNTLSRSPETVRNWAVKPGEGRLPPIWVDKQKLAEKKGVLGLDDLVALRSGEGATDGIGAADGVGVPGNGDFGGFGQNLNSEKSDESEGSGVAGMEVREAAERSDRLVESQIHHSHHILNNSEKIEKLRNNQRKDLLGGFKPSRVADTKTFVTRHQLFDNFKSSNLNFLVDEFTPKNPLKCKKTQKETIKKFYRPLGLFKRPIFLFNPKNFSS